MLRRSFLVPLVAMLLGLAAIPACRKKEKEAESGGGGGAGAPPAAVKSDYLLFAHLDGKQIRDSAVFTELKQAITKAGGEKEWDQVEGELAGKMGVKPTDVDAVTVCVTDIPDRGEPQFVLIVTTNKAIQKRGPVRAEGRAPSRTRRACTGSRATWSRTSPTTRRWR
jgi:hypothetical protein